MALMPLVFEPYLRPLLWGGRNLHRLFGKKLPAEGPFGESWEVSEHEQHISRVADGPLQGMSLTELCGKYPEELFSSQLPKDGRFPLLVKLLDCQELLSIQVHPNDELAGRLLGNDNGKTEAWVILHVEAGGRIHAGLREGISREELLHHLRAGTLDQCLHSFQPQPGDCLYLPAGTVHAVGGGIVLAEVQQTSDATFRLFDWNRVGSDGRPRPLHVEQALAAIDFSLGPVAPVAGRPIPAWDGLQIRPTPAAGSQAESLVRCPYFSLNRFRLTTPLALPNRDRLSIWMVIAGAAILRGSRCERSLAKGETVLIPACARDMSWQPSEPGQEMGLLQITL